MKHFGRMARLKQLLTCDLILSAGQFQRLGVDPKDLPAVTREVKVTQSEYALHIVTFYALSENHLRYRNTAQLAHIAGAAEIRLALGILPGEHWQTHAVKARMTGSRNIPDALWHADQGEVAIEYDAGWYSSETIRDKMAAFQAYKGIVWGTSSALRADRIKQRHPSAQVVLARWWEDQQDRDSTVQECRESLKAARIARLQGLR